MEQGVLRIHLLGEFRVRRSDGSQVQPEEWRTGKTRDLLRLLALQNGRVVRPDGLIEKLWPDVSRDRAHNSLRTATSRIRQATRVPCVVRRLGGIVLLDSWVDVVEFRALVGRVRIAARDGDHEQVLHVSRAAERLHAGEFNAHDDGSAWATAERNDLRRLRQEMLTDAAASALALELFREAVDLATIAARLDSTSEGAYRVLMRGHAELGEVAKALRAFETYRAHLADELGADPSPEARRLHLQLLRGKTP